MPVWFRDSDQLVRRSSGTVLPSPRTKTLEHSGNWLSFNLEGWEALRAKLEAGGPLYGPWREMLESAGQVVVARAKKRAPRGAHNSIAPTIRYDLVGKPVPLFVKVHFPNLTSGTHRGGVPFRYPGALEGGKRRHNFSRVITFGTRAGVRGRFTQLRQEIRGGGTYTYGPRGPAGKTGKPTRGWFIGSLTGAQKRISRLMQDAAKQIEAIWSK